MIESLSAVAAQVTVLFILIALGFYCSKKSIFDEPTIKHLTNFILYFVTPMVVINSFNREYDPLLGKKLLISAGCAAVAHFLSIAASYILIHDKDQAKRAVLRYGIIFSNCGYMGLPFLTLVFSKSERLGEILVYASIVMMIFYIFVWTVGVLYSSGDRKEMSFKKIITNPIMIAIFVSLIIFVTVKVPFKKMEIADANVKAFVDQLFNCLEMISNMVTPLSMIIVGMQLASSSLKNIFINKEAYLISALRLVVMPLITLVLVAFLPIDITIKYTIFFLLSMPVATITVLLIINYDGDSSLCSSSILLSNLLSIITIPLLFLLFDFVIKSI